MDHMYMYVLIHARAAIQFISCS